MHVDLIKNQLGGLVNGFLAQKLVSSTEMRYILKAICSEVAELELTEAYINNSRVDNKTKQLEEENNE